jgi:hypothetical protein
MVANPLTVKRSVFLNNSLSKKFDDQSQELERQVATLDADNKALRQKVTRLDYTLLLVLSTSHHSSPITM